jgi:hypothetical protein
MDVCTYPEARPSAPQPIVKPLSQRDRAGQIRAALGSRWRLPKVDEVTLTRYYRYLNERLSFPFTAWYPEPANSREERDYRCTVVQLIDPVTGLGDEFDGIFCKARRGKYERNLPLIELELSPSDPNYLLVENYWDWFWHWR